MKAQPGFKKLLFVIYFPSILMSVNRGMVFLIIPLFAIELGAGVGEAGLIFSLIGIGILIADVPTGFAIGRLGEKRLMLGGLLLVAVTVVLAGLSQSLLLLSITTLGFGIGKGIWTLARLHYLTEMIPLTQRGRAMSMMGGTERIGMFFGPTIGGVLSKFYGFESTLVLAAVSTLFVIGILLVILPENQQKVSVVASPKILTLVPRMLNHHKRIFLTAGMVAVALQLIRAGRQILIPLWGVSIGLDEAEIGIIYGFSFGVDMSLFLVAGFIMDRFGRKWAAIPCALILSLSLILLPLSYNFVTFLLIGLMAGLGNGLGAGIIMTLGGDLSPQTERSEFLGVWRLIGDAGGALGPAIIGLLSKVFVLGTASLVTGGIGLVGVGILAFFVKETLVKAKKPQPALQDQDW